MRDLLEVALLGKTVGLKGAIKLYDRSDFADQFKKGAKFHLKSGEILEILLFNRANSTAVFKDYEDINLASKLTNQVIFKTKEQTRATCKLKKDEFFYFDIIGLKIKENSVILGEVMDIIEAGSGYVFEIKTDENLSQNGLPTVFYLPYIDHFILKVDLTSGEILSQNALAILENS